MGTPVFFVVQVGQGLLGVVASFGDLARSVVMVSKGGHHAHAIIPSPLTKLAALVPATKENSSQVALQLPCWSTGPFKATAQINPFASSVARKSLTVFVGSHIVQSSGVPACPLREFKWFTNSGSQVFQSCGFSFYGRGGGFFKSVSSVALALSSKVIVLSSASASKPSSLIGSCLFLKSHVQ